MKICIDPGHGGQDPGTLGCLPETLVEKDFSLCLAFLLKRDLESLGNEVIPTRLSDYSLSLPQRANLANMVKADLFISLHANAAASPSVEGIEVFHFPGSSKGEALAINVLHIMHEEFPDHKSRGVKSANFSVLRLTTMPAILVECEFLTNPEQVAFLACSENQARMSKAIARGISVGA